MEHDSSQPRSLFNISRVKKRRRAEDCTEEEQWNDFLHSDHGKSWLASVLQREHELRGRPVRVRIFLQCQHSIRSYVRLSEPTSAHACMLAIY